MIRVSRGGGLEPRALRRARYAHLALCRARIGAGESLDRSDFVDYAGGRDRILAAQFERCAYCERLKDACEVDLEHFRPCAKYWWLTWSWSNQLVSCKRCNGPNHKGDKFPLLDESRRLAAEDAPPGDEEPFLIDPSTEDPIDYIRFVRVKGMWVPMPRNGSVRGRETIQLLGLDTLGPRYDRHWRDVILPRVKAIKVAIATGNVRRIQKEWGRALRELFHSKATFQALTFDALSDVFKAAIRERWRLDLPRPGSVVPGPVPDEPFVAELRPGSREAVYRLPGKASAEEVRWTVLVLCAERAMTYRELARYLTRREETVATCVRPLVDQGRLQRMGNTKPYRFALVR